MPSFDVVSKVDMHEMDNAVDQTKREIATRFDFKGTKASIEQKEETITISGDSTFHLSQILEILYNKLAKRGIDLGSLELGPKEERGMSAFQTITVRQGIDKETGKKIVKSIKESKLKVQASIQSDQVRITGKKRDDLQEAIAFLKSADLGVPLQYSNFRD